MLLLCGGKRYRAAINRSLVSNTGSKSEDLLLWLGLMIECLVLCLIPQMCCSKMNGRRSTTAKGSIKTLWVGRTGRSLECSQRTAEVRLDELALINGEVLELWLLVTRVAGW